MKNNSTQHIIDIANEMNVSREHVCNIRQHEGFLTFSINGVDYTNKLTKTGRHKKNSVRRAV